MCLHLCGLTFCSVLTLTAPFSLALLEDAAFHSVRHSLEFFPPSDCYKHTHIMSLYNQKDITHFEFALQIDDEDFRLNSLSHTKLKVTRKCLQVDIPQIFKNCTKLFTQKH